ncbi:MAG: FKBP-type peptidyl-prolyl cis-trans isomerase [Actinobacteria bacterium]|nr:FKBP-type peptidyl-prolyl cis-trans isomerase [Actinomycetota bacterium]
MPARPPSKLVVKDLKVGTGPAAKLGDTIKVNYIGISCSTGKQFDSSYDRGQPVEFPLQAGGLIKGWVEGIPGMKVGGQRQLTIPPSLGYGAQGNQGIAPNETLVFVIDLVSTTPASQTTTTGASSTTPATSTSTAPSTTAGGSGSTTTTAATSTTGG